MRQHNKKINSTTCKKVIRRLEEYGHYLKDGDYFILRWYHNEFGNDNCEGLPSCALMEMKYSKNSDYSYAGVQTYDAEGNPKHWSPRGIQFDVAITDLLMSNDWIVDEDSYCGELLITLPCDEMQRIKKIKKERAQKKFNKIMEVTRQQREEEDKRVVEFMKKRWGIE